tara:strand:- start:1758 stop:2870 length:1113 start_codon:yes stop_codon:yes gene_type:complete
MDHKSLIKKNLFRNNFKILNRQVLLRLYYFMKRLRICEVELEKEYHPADQMRCPIHFCVGQEAIPAALSEILNKNDYLFSHHRSHGYYLAKNCPTKYLFAELYGKKTGANGGLAGSMDLSYPRNNFFGGAILAGAASIAMGVAMSFKLNKNNKNVVFAGLGDGATEEGLYWETLNYSSLKKLPIIFICENNNYSTYAPQSKRQVGDSISKRAKSFGIKSYQIFGNDVSKLYEIFDYTSKQARKGKGPFLIEAFTYRTSSHVGTVEEEKNIKYRNNKEQIFWKKNDPIKVLESFLKAQHILNRKKKTKLEKKIYSEIKKSFSFAKKSKFPTDNNWKNLNYDSSHSKVKTKLKKLRGSVFNVDQSQVLPKGF